MLLSQGFSSIVMLAYTVQQLNLCVEFIHVNLPDRNMSESIFFYVQNFKNVHPIYLTSVTDP